ncbi:MAG: hypothetical protein WCA16_18625, partial [Candidatus Sulfotelmatobacter sp.]
KTLYGFAKQKTIPHVRLKGNVRFPALELQKWVSRHSHLPREMRDRRHAAKSRAKCRRPARAR